MNSLLNNICSRSSDGRAVDFLDSSREILPLYGGDSMNILSSHFIGEITEQEVAIEFLKLGILVSKPLVQSSRYDFIADINHKLYKIQVKTSTPKENNSYLQFATSTSHTNTQGTLNLTYSEEDVDFFATMYEGQCYLIPHHVCGKRAQRLRLVPTLNGQTAGITFAKDYKL